MLLLDASVWVAATDPDAQQFAASRELAVDPAYPVAALDLALYEIGNALGVRRARPAAAVDLCRLVVARSGAQLVRMDPQLLVAGLEVAAEHGLTAYDASYVAAARRHDWTLVSLDIADLVSKGLAVTPDAAV